MANEQSTTVVTTTTKVSYLEGSRFVEKELQAKTVGEMRTELNIPANAEIAVNRVDQPDTYELQEDDQIAAVVEDKTGGKNR